MSFARATRKGTHVLIGLTGHSGSGKTMGALLLARGLVGPAGRIAGIDTENGRMSHFSDQTEFDVDELHPPFTSARYTEKVKEAQAAGYNALIIDSFSHEWEGEGGVVEMAESQTDKYGKPLQGLARWNRPKSEHKKLVNAILQCRMHVIICMRGKDKLIQTKDEKGKEIIVNAGVVPIQDSRFIFEMTVSLVMDQETKKPRILKCPDVLRAAFPSDAHLTTAAGKAVAEWVNGAAPVDHDLEALKIEAREVAEAGTAKLTEYWTGLPLEKQQSLEPIKRDCWSIAKTADEQSRSGAA